MSIAGPLEGSKISRARNTPLTALESASYSGGLYAEAGNTAFLSETRTLPRTGALH